MIPRNAYLQIHICVVLWGFTAVFGKLITLPALPLVWWRMFLVSVILAMVPRVWRAVAGMPGRLIAAYAGVGVVIALHWLTFYGSIKLSNASVGATCMALAPVFLAFIEPLIVKRRFDMRELALGAAMIPGVILVVGGVPSGMRLGIAVGALSALFVAIFGTWNKLLVHRADPLAVTAIELTAGALLLTIISAVMPGSESSFVMPGTRDAIYLLVLAVGCTIVPFTLALVALRYLTAFAAQLAVNLEPVYAIVLATLLLGEHHDLGARFYLGVAIILLLVLLYPYVVRRPPPSAHPEVLVKAAFVLILTLVTSAPLLAAEKNENQKVGRAVLTFYWIVDESSSRYDGKRETALRDARGKVIARTHARFRKDLVMEGTGWLRDGRTVRFDKTTGGEHRFKIIKSRYGLTARGCPADPYRTVAVDPKFVKLGSKIYIPELKGTVLPDGSKHDGIFVANDRGGFRGAHVDVFVGVGPRSTRPFIRKGYPSRSRVTVYLEGSSVRRCRV